MKSSVILAICVGLISCASFSVPVVGSPFDQLLLPKLNLPFSQVPQQPNQVQAPQCNCANQNQVPRQNNQAPRFRNPQQPIRQRPAPRQPWAKPDRSYVFSWKWACRSGISFADCQGKFYWNDQLVANIIPSDYNVHTATYNVKAKNGINKLRIEGSGVSSSYGLTIDDVSIVKKGRNYNYVINGDFETPNQNGGWSVYTNTNGWTGRDIEIGKGTIYNAGWASQVCELDGNANSLLNQDITLKVTPSRGNFYRDNEANSYGNDYNEGNSYGNDYNEGNSYGNDDSSSDYSSSEGTNCRRSN